MKQRTIAILLSIMFATLTVASDVIVLMDSDSDISLLIDTSEEEERKGEEKIKDFEIEILSYVVFDYTYRTIKKVETLNLHINNYSSVYKELTSPPPETNI